MIANSSANRPTQESRLPASTLRPGTLPNERRELKFRLYPADVGRLRELLGGLCKAVKHASLVSHVKSIYWDDAHFSSAQANTNGVGRRTKVRLRWYDLDLPRHELYLELKMRCNRLTGKHRSLESSAESWAEMRYSRMHALLCDRVPPEFLPTVLRNFQPVVLIEYKREHFVLPDTQVRVTLDYDIRAYDQVGKQRIYRGFGRPVEHLTLLEGKTPAGEEASLQSLLAPLHIRAGRCSKYVECCQALGYVHT